MALVPKSSTEMSTKAGVSFTAKRNYGGLREREREREREGGGEKHCKKNI